MRQYDLIVIGSGSAMNIVEPMIQENPKIKIAVIDKDEPGGICLTRGCIPSKILLYPAELVRTLEKAKDLGVNAEIKKIDFSFIMGRMKSLLSKDIEAIREGLSNSPNIDYFHAAAEFVSPYTLKLAGEKAGDSITAKMIFLCIGSTTIIPPIEGLEKTGYLTSDTVLNLTSMPKSISIVGGGYIAAEYGHFFSSMGSKVTIIGRNPQFLPEEEPEISEIAMKELGNHMKILTDHEVKAVMRTGDGQKRVSAIDRESGKNREVNSEEIMIAAGRGPITEVLHPERGGIRTSKEGWIQVNEYFETSQPNVWAFGDADGRYPFKHVANYESEIVYYNAVLKRRVKADYHAIPHAVFTYPEVASVGMKEEEAVKQLGNENILVGRYEYENTAKGEAMDVKGHGYFVKIIAERSTRRILGAHIVGPQASILIHEIINVMYTREQDVQVINQAIHIHPALSEVVQRAVGALRPVATRRHEHVEEAEPRRLTPKKAKPVTSESA